MSVKSLQGRHTTYATRIKLMTELNSAWPIALPQEGLASVSWCVCVCVCVCVVVVNAHFHCLFIRCFSECGA